MPVETVSVDVKYSGDKGDVRVTPDEVTIYYNRKGDPGDPSLARRVRMDIDGLFEGDLVVVRPKKSLDAWKRTVFVPPAGKKHFEATSKEKSIDCGPPVFGADPGSFPIRWEYEVVVLRGGREIGSRDPAVLIDEDP